MTRVFTENQEQAFCRFIQDKNNEKQWEIAQRGVRGRWGVKNWMASSMLCSMLLFTGLLALNSVFRWEMWLPLLFIVPLILGSIIMWMGLRKYCGRHPGLLREMWRGFGLLELENMQNREEYWDQLHAWRPSRVSLVSFCKEIPRWMENGVDAPYAQWGDFIQKHGYVSREMEMQKEAIVAKLNRLEEQQAVLETMTIMTGLQESALQKSGFAEAPVGLSGEERQKVALDWAQMAHRVR